jgi:hypothetical protein
MLGALHHTKQQANAAYTTSGYSICSVLYAIEWVILRCFIGAEVNVCHFALSTAWASVWSP